jgi:hypothetical protein
MILAPMLFAVTAGFKHDFALATGKLLLERLLAIDVVHLNMLAPGLPCEDIPATFVQAPEFGLRDSVIEFAHLCGNNAWGEYDDLFVDDGPISYPSPWGGSVQWSGPVLG